MVDFNSHSLSDVSDINSLSSSHSPSPSPSMPPFIPLDTGYSLGHHCVGIQVASGNSPIVSPTRWHHVFCPYIWLRDREAESGQRRECEISYANTTEHKCAPCWWSRESRPVGVLWVKRIVRRICRWTQTHTVPKFLSQSHLFLTHCLCFLFLSIPQAINRNWGKIEQRFNSLILANA